MEEAVRELRAELTGKRRKDHEDTGEGDEE